MRQIFALMVGLMIAGMAYGYEVTLGTDPVVVVAETRAVAVSEFAKRTNGMTVSVGDIRSVHGRAYIAAVGGNTSTALQTNVIGTVTNANEAVVIVSAEEAPTPDVRGTYNLATENVWTNGAYAIWINGEDWILGLAEDAGEPGDLTAIYAGRSLEEMSNENDDPVTFAYGETVSDVTEVVFAPIAAGDRIVDGDVVWVIVPQTRQGLYLKSVSGDAVLVDGRGNRIYAETLPGYRGAVYGTSTNAAKISVFWY